MHSLVIVGGGGVGRQFEQVVADINADNMIWEVLGYLDDDVRKAGAVIGDFSVIGTHRWIANHSDVFAALAIGNSAVRWRVYRRGSMSWRRRPSRNTNSSP